MRDVMYQPRKALIEMQPRCRTLRLGEIELGGLVLLDDARSAGALGVRADALSRQGEISEGVLHLKEQGLRFERRAIDETLLALDIEYLLEPELASAEVRAPHCGDLVLSRGRTGAGLWLPGPWGGSAALFDMASATIRPFDAAAVAAPLLALAWRLVERSARSRVLWQHRGAPAAREEAAPRGRFSEESD